MPSVCVVVVSQNSEVLLGACLNALQSQTRPADELIVIDNASSDGSTELVRSRYPEARLMALNQSAGIAPAVNLAIDETSADILAVVLPQAVVETDWLQTVLEHADDEWDCWATRVKDGEKLHSCGLVMTVVGRTLHAGRGRPAAEFSKTGEVFGCCYPVAVYRRALLVDVLGFDSDFFVEADDADVAFRGRLRGHRCLFVPGAIARLQPGTTKALPEHVFFRERNTAFLFWQNMPPTLLVLYLPERLIYQFGVFLSRLLSLKAYSYVRAKIHVLRNVGKVLKKRSRVQAGRKLNGRDLRRHLRRNWLTRY